MSQQINLCNPMFRKQKKYFSALTMIEALGLILLGVILFYGYLNYQTRSLEMQDRQMTQLQDNAKHQLSELAARVGNHKPSQILADRVAQLEQAAHTELSILDLLQHGELGNQSGFSPYFVALAQQTVNDLWLTGFDISGKADQVKLEGRALQPELVAKLIQQLKNEPVFAGIHYTRLDISRPELTDQKTPKTGNNESADSTVSSSAAPYIEFTLIKTASGQTK